MTTRDTDWDGVRLHVVTGKGGTGKTTVAAALALALATAGRKVLLIEVEGRQGIAQALRLPAAAVRGAEGRDRPGDGRHGPRQGGDVYALAVDPEGALLDYLEMFYNLRSAGNGADQARRGGLRDHDRARPVRRAGHRQGHRGGRGRRRGPAQRLRLRRGRDGRPADRPDRPLPQRHAPRSPGWPRSARSAPTPTPWPKVIRSPQTAVHFVTTLEEMPVQETLDGIAELRELTGGAIRPGGIIINMARPRDARRRRPGRARPAARSTSPSSPSA